MIILDTNVISEVAKPDASPNVIAWLNRQSEDALYLTTIIIAELNAGVHKKDAGKRRDDLEQRFKETVQLFSGRTLPFDLGAALVFGGIISDARRKGKAIGFQDGLIAAVATYRKCAVATRDVKPFKAAGVEVINPWNADPDTGIIK